jgi:hypothetical protein
MRQLFIMLLCLGLGVGPAPATMTLTGVGGPAAVVGYTGPGDAISSGWIFWGGLRAFSAATRGTKAVNACNSTGGTDVGCGDLSTDATTGKLVAGTIGGITCPGANCTVKVIYDQSGASKCSGPCDAIQPTIGGRPSLDANCLNTTLPCMSTVAANTPFMNTPGIAVTSSLPLTYVVVSKITITTEGGLFGTYGAGPEIVNNNAAANQANIYNSGPGSVDLGSVANSAWHAIQGVFNGASSFVCADGTCSSNGNAGSSVWTSGNALILFSGNFSDRWTGSAVEFGVNTAAFTSGGTTTTYCHNDSAYWGTPAC